MTDQLALIDSHRSWRLDTPTRQAGIRGVARARQALREARSRVVLVEGPGMGDVETDDGGPGAVGRGSEPDVVAPAA